MDWIRFIIFILKIKLISNKIDFENFNPIKYIFYQLFHKFNTLLHPLERFPLDEDELMKSLEEHHIIIFLPN